MPSSKFTSQSNLSKCTNPPQLPVDPAADAQLNRWPPTAATVDRLILQLKAKDPDTEANWKKIILNFKKELAAEEEEKEKLKPALTSDVVNSSSCGGGGGIEERDGVRVRAKFSVPLSRREMEKDFEDMGERRLPRKPKKRPKSLQNQLDTLFPGLWLTEINADLYRVSDTKKR
ncbi:hypothetical protein HanPI659440_Chr16g0657401 [Helianthus annuus]|nr:hypothetical protein HanPI659440_Chr16g0657401 [Helianthus annuus]